MKKEDAEYVLRKINNEGFHHGFICSDFEEIKDKKFHNLRMKCLKLIEKFENYLIKESE